MSAASLSAALEEAKGFDLVVGSWWFS